MVARAQGSTRVGAPPPGRDEDLRDILVLLDYQRLVAVVGGRGSGRTDVLRSVAERYGVTLAEGRAPKSVARGDLVVLDDADALASRTLKALVRRVLAADGRLVLSARSATLVPPQAMVHRLGGLAPDAATVILGSRITGHRAMVQRLAAHVRGHPGLLGMSAELLSSKRPPRGFEVAADALAARVRTTYLDALPRSQLEAAKLLAAAGGWLPAALDIEGFADAAPALTQAGLADLVDGGVEASPLLLVARLDLPAKDVLRQTVAALTERRALARALIRLAEAHLHLNLGENAEALEAVRDAHRFARGAMRTEVFARSLDRLAHGEPSPLTGCARLASLIYRFGPARLGDDVAEAVTGLLDAGQLETPEVCEARTYLAYLDLEGDGPQAALSGLVRAAELAASVGDVYAEAQALLWQAWVNLLTDAPQAAAQIADRAARLARKADAPVLQSRSLYCLSRADLAEEAYDTAGRRLQQALRLTRRHQLDDDQTVVLDALADIAGRQGRPSEAAEYLDAADAILARFGNLPRKGALAVTRAEVALRRGHVTEAKRILSGAEVALAEEPWRRDLLLAEVAWAAGDSIEAREALVVAARHPTAAQGWLRRRAVVAAGLLREGVDPTIDLDELAADPVAAFHLDAARGRFPDASAKLDRFERELPDEMPDLEPSILREAILIRLLEGRRADAAEYGRRLRDRFAESAASTSTMLVLEALDHLFRGDPLTAAHRAAVAMRAAKQLGQARTYALALRLVAASHLILGRERGLERILGRAERAAQRAGCPARQAGAAALRVLADVRFGRTPKEVDRAAAIEGPNRFAAAVVRIAIGEADTSPVAGAAARIVGILLTGERDGTPWTPTGPEVAIELTLDGANREVILAGGKRIPFGRRRVLWRLLWFLFEASGDTIAPESLYVAAWELPFNQSRLNSLYVGVRRLRLLVEPDPSSARIIMAGHNGGYYMDTRRVQATGDSPMGEDG